MRLIDADALFGEYERAAWYNNADRDEIAEEVLLQMPTIDPESLRPKWISVEDRLPEVGRSVIAFNAHAKCAAEAVYKGDGKFLQFRWAARLQEQEVTHWMPPPEPPDTEDCP